MNNIYTFTNCGATGRSGPTQSQVNSAYNNTNSLYGKVTSNTGVQSFVVPEEGLYIIEARGAEGATASQYPYMGGKGAVQIGAFKLEAGSILKILVGQMGEQSSHDGGGGGGTFVAKVDAMSPHIFTRTNQRVKLLIAAGGGGGSSYAGNTNAMGMDAVLDTFGTMGTVPGTNGYAGTDGNGGTCSSNGYSSAGGGFLTSGKGTPISNHYPGASFLSGGVGGDSYTGNAAGGFGGGGGTHGGGWGGGGGGGYSGGSTSTEYRYGGGGGGSYNIGSYKSGFVGNIGHGIVILQRVDLSGLYTFRTCGAIGRYGPSQSQINSTYAFGDSLYNKVTRIGDGVQQWTVPVSGKYTIEVRGAQGGTPFGGTYKVNGDGGMGAVQKGTFSLTKGTRLKILVGQKGGPGTHDGGGGGGSFVVKNEQGGSSYLFTPTSEYITPLIIAGGGGGGGYISSSNGGGQNASLTESGTIGTVPGGGGYGGINGNGGVASSNGYASAGGGFLTKGVANSHYGTDFPGLSFLSGGLGGSSYIGENEYTSCGGFGCGGGTHSNGWGGGGGGGYSGGSTSSGSQYGGGGGGSFNSGLEQSSSISNLGDGLVIIRLETLICYFAEQDDMIYLTDKDNYDVLTDTFTAIPKDNIYDYVHLIYDTGNQVAATSPNQIFEEFQVLDSYGVSYKTIKPLKYFNKNKLKIFAITESTNSYNMNKIKMNYKLNAAALAKCQIKLKDDIVILDNNYDRHFVINASTSIMTMIKKYDKYYNKNSSVDSLSNILLTGIPNNKIEDYNIEANVINLSVGFSKNIDVFSPGDKLSQIKLVAKTGNNYRKLVLQETVITSNEDLIFIKFRDAHNEVIINSLHKKPSREALVNTLEEF